MRKLFIITLFAILASQVQAQSLDALLQGLMSMMGGTTENTQSAAEEAKITHPEVYELIGRWAFDGLVMDYTGDSTVASVAVATLEGQLSLLATKFDLVVGRDYAEISEDGMVTFACGESRVRAHCTSYDSYDGEVTLMFYLAEGKMVSITGVVVEQGGKTRVLFSANKVMDLLAKNYSKFNENTTLQMAKTVIDSYPGIRVGAAMKRVER